MKIYSFLSRIPRAGKKYALKFFLITLPVIIFPLIELALFDKAAGASMNSAMRTISYITVAVTMILCLLTFYLFNKLIAPLLLAKEALSCLMNMKMRQAYYSQTFRPPLQSWMASLRRKAI